MACEQFILTLKNQVSELEKLTNFIDENGEKMGLSPAMIMSLNLCMEEAVSNVIFYAYPEGEDYHDIQIEFSKTDNLLTFVISDTGKPFDPTAQAEADITLSADDRPIGGLGIFLYKQIMTSVNYQRVNDTNVLTMTKAIDN